MIRELYNGDCTTTISFHPRAGHCAIPRKKIATLNILVARCSTEPKQLPKTQVLYTMELIENAIKVITLEKERTNILPVGSRRISTTGTLFQSSTSKAGGT